MLKEMIYLGNGIFTFETGYPVKYHFLSNDSVHITEEMIGENE